MCKHIEGDPWSKTAQDSIMMIHKHFLWYLCKVGCGWAGRGSGLFCHHTIILQRGLKHKRIRTEENPDRGKSKPRMSYRTFSGREGREQWP